MSEPIATDIDELRWRAVYARDAAADDSFVFGVATTGIYCRPSCPSRRAKRENLRFFARPEDAATSGYRPCKRCRPQDAASREAIVYAFAETSLGTATVAATAEGVCAIRLTDTAEAGEAELRALFPEARLAFGEDGFDPTLREVAAAIEDPRRADALPLDLRGTPFQRRVWDALRAIPAGATATYAGVAAAIAAPRGRRAVAQACRANPVAVLVPCHRVGRADGAPSGYRWGAERKRALLRREGAW